MRGPYRARMVAEPDDAPGSMPDGGAAADDAADPVADDLERWADELADGVDADRIADEERVASQRSSSIEAGRRKGGAAGAAMAGAMLALRDIYEGPPKDDVVAVSESPDEPEDIDRDGITIRLDDREVRSRPPSADDVG